ncbi:hypothetical protein [Paracoccus sp. MC1862]|uniref:hypothetical protein n=1 Tax=Paracoccus sp. MC1862 TaxID=2760307 RepID=UPI001601EF63|nr:hypothetical protein [Paracoccus sp. MC1862]MBB1498539.1 hypothetical protein [Paracoccus sp. MC1862]QQO43883.1 hypothetical protein JGR78_10655 [Paracoccus sp. MC1862]
MSEREPTNAELIAAAVGIALASRDLIKRTDRTSFRDVGQTLDALHEGMAVAGGSLLHLAERLGVQADVDRLVKQGQDRIATVRAFAGTEGRA